MKSKVTLFFSVLLLASKLGAQTVTPLYNFETGTTQAGTYVMAWPGAPYITSYATGSNPDGAGINASSTSLNLVEVTGTNWWDNLSIFTLTSPVTITASNRYLHIMYRTSHIAGGGYSINLNSNSMLTDGDKGNTRFDANLTANNVWQDIVIDLNYLKTNSIQFTKFCMNPDLNGWGAGSGGTYNFDEIVLSSSPLPRGTTFLTANNLYDFESGTSGNISGVTTYSDAGNPVTYPVANPYQTFTNQTTNSGKRSAISSINWWVGFSFSFVNPIQIDVNHKYLHVMVIAPSAGQSVAFDVKQGATNVISDNPHTISSANTWQDVVIDVSSMAYISGMSIKCGNWGGTAAGDYYFDEIWIDGSSTPRPYTVALSSGTTNASSINCTTCDVTVAAGAELTVDATKTLKTVTVAAGGKLTLGSAALTTDMITLQSDVTGTATLVDNTTTTPQAITATVQQYVEAGRNWYMSIPLASGASSLLSRGTSVVCFDEPTSAWIAPAAGTLHKLRGYIQTATNTPLTGTTGTVDFTGVVNTGAHNISLSRTTGQTGFNLVGNPYPSYLDWNLVTRTNVLPTMWYRTKEGGVYKFYTFVANGSAGVGSPASVTNKIPPMQAFWVRVNTVGTGSIAVDNDMRAHKDVSGNIMKAPTQTPQKLLRLQVSNGINTDETVLYFNANALDIFDQFDAPKQSNEELDIPEIYTQVGAEQLVINGMKEVKYNTEIPIGFSTLAANNFSISANEISNFETGTKVILLDKQNPTVETELTNGTTYNFSAPVTTATTSRFSLLFRAPGVTIGVDNSTKLDAQVYVNATNQITIIAPEKSNYTIYNAVGQLIENGVTNYKLHTVNYKLNTGVYVVKVNNESTRVIVK